MSMQQFVSLLSLFLGHPINKGAALIGGYLVTALLWKFTLSLFSFTTREFERSRNRRAIRATIRFVKQKATKIWTVLTAKPKAGPDSAWKIRAALWVEAATYCVFVSWFVVYATALVILTALYMYMSSPKLAHIALFVMALGMVRIAGFYRQRALDIRNALLG